MLTAAGARPAAGPGTAAAAGAGAGAGAGADLDPGAAAAAELERRFGDPDDAANPLGHAAFGAADERGELLAAGEALLADWGFNAEFVPVALGGRLGAADRLGRVLRPVFRRDASLGLGYGVTSLMAAVNVWTAGSARQQAALAGLLLAGGRAAVAFHELGHGNDLLGNDFRARPEGGRLILTGRKEVINNVDRAQALVLFARTADAPGARSHSVLYLPDPPAGEPPAEGVRRLGRHASAGVRGCRLGGIAFDGAQVGADAVLGRLGDGVETALKAFQLTRAVLPGMALGAVDASIRSVLRFARTRRLYRTTVADLPHAGATLVGAFVDLLAADCLATAGARALHLFPRECSAYAAAVKFAVPMLAEDALTGLATVLGARSYLREGEHAVVGRHLRDLPLLAIGHAGGAACLLTIMPQLPALARRSWTAGGAGSAPAPDALFDPEAGLPELDLRALRVAGTGRDPLGATLLQAVDDPELAASADWADQADLPRLVGDLAGRLRRLGDASAAAPPSECGPAASPAAFDRAREAALLWTAAACVGTWRVHRCRGGGAGAGSPGASAFLGDAAWLAAALRRLTDRIRDRAGGRREPAPPALDHVLFTEMLGRLEAGRAFCLDPAHVSG
jgi:alkylation response protein AidB-like acyl-CoA dehydrogenase